jgi:hypothetical protein
MISQNSLSESNSLDQSKSNPAQLAQQGYLNALKSLLDKNAKIEIAFSNIKIEKKEINNFYTQKKEEIKSADKKQIDSLLRKRYNY